MNPRLQKKISVAIGGIGLALVAMMVVVESEPGLLPLLLVLSGVIGYITALLRKKV